MREVKFRAWDKLNNCMRAVAGMDWKDGEMHDGGIVQELKDVEIMQFTGLKDKKGKEIYEGDIVETFKEYESGRVYWDGAGYWGIHSENSRKFIAENATRLSAYGQHDLTIVGNIYEHSHLLA